QQRTRNESRGRTRVQGRPEGSDRRAQSCGRQRSVLRVAQYRSRMAGVAPQPPRVRAAVVQGLTEIGRRPWKHLIVKTHITLATLLVASISALSLDVTFARSYGRRF